MSQCIDRSLGDRLFAYELGLLAADDEEAVELHLLQCEHCLTLAKAFGPAVDRLRDHPAAQAIIKKVEAAEGTASVAGAKTKGWFSFSRAAVLVAAAVVILMLRPWGLHFQTTEEAVADESRIAVMYVDNLADPTDSLRLGDIATDLLITGLSQSQSVQVVSSQRLYDILKLIGREGQKKIDRSVATEVARKSRAKWMVLGSILESTPHLIMTTQLVDVATGEVASAARIQGKKGETILELTDSLTAKIGYDLNWPVDAESELSRRAAYQKTNSLDAYRYYVEGVESFYKYDIGATARCFRKTLEIDSTFAMAYYWIARYRWLWYSNADTVSIAKAVQYSDNATHREQLYIKSMQALIVADYPRGIAILEELAARYPDEKEAYALLGICYGRLHELQRSTDYYFKSLELDSLFADAYVVLMFNLFNLGDYERSAWASDKYISLRPTDPAPYSFRGDIEAMNGDLDRAIVWYKKAVALGTGDDLQVLGHAYLIKRQYASADSCYQLMASSVDRKDRRSGGRVCLALVPFYQGRFAETMRILDDGIAADRMEKFALRAYKNKRIFKAMIYEQLGRLDSALFEIEQIKAVYPKNYHWLEKFYGPPNYARLLALNKRFDEAEQVAEDLRLQMGGNESVISDYWWTVGNIEMAKENWGAAISNFEAAIQHSDSEFTYRASISYARLQAGKPADAIIELEKGLKNKHLWRLAVPIEAVKAYYYLGMAYEQTGRKDDAIKQYEEFLDIWKDADPGISEIDDARARLARLTARS